MDVQNALTQFEQSKRAESLPLTTDEHIFLVLDRNVQEIPWESIPILRGRAVSRIPSLSFLLDRIPRAIPGGQPIDPDVWRKGIDPRRTFFILNPSGDLTKTEATFKEWAEGMVRDCQWRGIVGREPSLLEVKQALEGYDLVM
jgi:separase